MGLWITEQDIIQVLKGDNFILKPHWKEWGLPTCSFSLYFWCRSAAHWLPSWMHAEETQIFPNASFVFQHLRFCFQPLILSAAHLVFTACFSTGFFPPVALLFLFPHWQHFTHGQTRHAGGTALHPPAGTAGTKWTTLCKALAHVWIWISFWLPGGLLAVVPCSFGHPLCQYRTARQKSKVSHDFHTQMLNICHGYPWHQLPPNGHHNEDLVNPGLPAATSFSS